MEIMTKDDYPSSEHAFYEALIQDRTLFESKILEMEEEQVIAFYEHVLGETLKIESDTEDVEHENLWYVKRYLEFLEVIENYLSTREEKVPLTEEDERQIEEIVQLIEKRQHLHPFKRLIKYIKG